MGEQLGSNAQENSSTGSPTSPVELSSVALVLPVLLSASPSPEELPEASGPELSPDVCSSPFVDPEPLPAVSLSAPDPVDSSEGPAPSASEVVISVLPDALDPLVPSEVTDVDEGFVVSSVSVSSDEDVQPHSMEMRITRVECRILAQIVDIPRSNKSLPTPRHG